LGPRLTNSPEKEVSEVKMRKNIIGVLAILFVLALTLPTACAGAEFQLSSLEIAPEKVGTGNTATIHVDVTNNGTADGIYSTTLTVDGVPIETKDVAVPAGAKRKVTFSLAKEKAGIYAVEVGGLSGELHVVQPAEFQITSLEVSPGEVVLGDEATAVVEISNIGEVEGEYNCPLLVDDVKVQEKNITLAGGATETLRFTLTPEKPGSCQVAAGEYTETIQVTEPPEPVKVTPARFTVTNLRVTLAPIASETPCTISVDITNSGGARGTYQLRCRVGNEEMETIEVQLNPGEKETVTLSEAESVILALATQYITGEIEENEHVLSADGLSTRVDLDELAPPKPTVMLQLLWSRAMYGIGILITGEVKNISDESLKDVEVVIEFYDKDRKLVQTVSSLIKKNPLKPGETSKFEFQAIQEADVHQEGGVYNLYFRFRSGEKIPFELGPEYTGSR